MQLTQFTDYSLRTLLYLAERPDRLCTVGEVAEWYGISRPHLVKVVHRLSQLGYIKSAKGKGGGISLNKLPCDINIGRLARETEPNFHTVECFDESRNTCRISAKCKLKVALHKATQRFLETLDQHTLNDLILTPKGDVL